MLAVAAIVGAGLGSLATAPGATAASAPSGWLDVVNAYRTSTGLPAVVANPALQQGVDLHVAYLAATGSMQHGEAPGDPHYTPEGALAGEQSLLAGWRGTDRTDRELVEGWVVAPFHLVHLLEPRLKSVAFASRHDPADASFDVAGVLNVVGGVGPKVGQDRPIVFPADGSVVPLTTFITETPDPLVGCPGYSAPAGLGIVALFPTAPGKVTTQITRDGRPVEHCLVDAGYQNRDAAQQATVRSILVQKNAVVLMPRRPLDPGATYEVTVQGDQSITWRFTTAAEGSALPSAGATSPLSVVPARLALTRKATKR